jgi:hypothetical protein
MYLHKTEAVDVLGVCLSIVVCVCVCVWPNWVRYLHHNSRCIITFEGLLLDYYLPVYYWDPKAKQIIVTL